MADKKYRVAVLPGDGIGPEVMNEALKALNAAAEKFAFSESKVTSMLHRTRKKLLRCLKEEGLC